MTDTTTRADPLDRAERLRSRLDALREEIERLREEDERLGSELSTLLLEGEDESDEARSLREERADVRARLAEREGLLPDLEAKVEGETRSAVREAATARLQTIKRKLGGLAGERPRMLERVEEARAALEEAERTVEQAVGRYSALRTEAVALADLFALDLPDFREIATKEANPRQRSAFEDPDEYLREAVRRVEGYGEESPSADLLELHGFDLVEYRERKNAAKKAERKAEKEEAEALRNHVDSFLRQTLSGGPVERRTVLRRAASAGFETASNFDRTSLQDAQSRVGVRTLSAREGGRIYYALATQPYDSNRFKEVRSSGGVLEGVR